MDHLHSQNLEPRRDVSQTMVAVICAMMMRGREPCSLDDSERFQFQFQFVYSQPIRIEAVREQDPI